MAKVILKTPKECRNAYRDVLQGYSFIPNGEKYIKHFAEADLGLLESLYNSYTIEASDLGLTSEEEKLEFLAAEGYWTEQEEEGYVNGQNAVSDAKDHLSKLVIPEQIEEFESIVADEEKSLYAIKKERNDLIPPTIETYCDKKINEDYVYYAVYKDKDLKEAYYTKEEFDDLSYREISELIKEYNEAIAPYTELNIKRIAVNSFFLNAFLMADNDPVKFYGKSVLELTIYQMNLFTRGKFCKTILTEGKDPPDEYYKDEKRGVENLMNWFDNQYNVIRAERDKRNHQAQASASMSGNRTKKPPRRVRRSGRRR